MCVCVGLNGRMGTGNTGCMLSAQTHSRNHYFTPPKLHDDEEMRRKSNRTRSSKQQQMRRPTHSHRFMRVYFTCGRVALCARVITACVQTHTHTHTRFTTPPSTPAAMYVYMHKMSRCQSCWPLTLLLTFSTLRIRGRNGRMFAH